MYIILGIALYFVALAIVAHNAPRGYEDNNGFHYGDPPKKGN